MANPSVKKSVRNGLAAVTMGAHLGMVWGGLPIVCAEAPGRVRISSTVAETAPENAPKNPPARQPVAPRARAQTSIGQSGPAKDTPAARTPRPAAPSSNAARRSKTAKAGAIVQIGQDDIDDSSDAATEAEGEISRETPASAAARHVDPLQGLLDQSV